jgi:thiosulfate dehydrogenase
MKHFTIVVALVMLVLACGPHEKKSPASVIGEKTDQKDLFTAPDTNSLGNDAWSDLVRYGARLVRHTAYFIGPEGTVRRNLGNKMNCTNCHLEVGTKPFGLNFFDSHKIYPQYRARENAILTMSDRVNNCVTRPHNGKPLPLDCKEMLAIVSYIKWVGENYDRQIHEGFGLLPIKYDSLRADAAHGEFVFKKHCVECHQQDGQGKMKLDNSTYEYPPLWGPKSFQEGSSMHRIVKAARFIKYNMPNLKTTWDKPSLSDQEALDVAAFINDVSIHPRPHSPYPAYENIETKPIDYFKGPYLDGFPEDVHTFGPWYEIKKFYTDKGLKVHL